jgi:hypothetical protein
MAFSLGQCRIFLWAPQDSFTVPGRDVCQHNLRLDPTHDFRFAGPGGPLSDDGLDVEFTASDKAPSVPGGTCNGASQRAAKQRVPWLAIALGALVLVVAGLAAWVIASRRRERAAR